MCTFAGFSDEVLCCVQLENTVLFLFDSFSHVLSSILIPPQCRAQADMVAYKEDRDRKSEINSVAEVSDADEELMHMIEQRY